MAALQVEQQLLFSPGAPTTQVWQYTPQDGSNTEYTWQATYSKHDGSHVALDAKQATDESLVLPRSPGTEMAKRTVRVVADMVEWTAVKSVLVTLRYSDPSAALHVERQLRFTAGTPTTQVWQFTPLDPSKTQYSWQATYRKHNGSQVALDVAHASHESLVLPPHPA